MDDDLNTADAISVIFELVADVNKVITENPNKDVCIKCAAAIRELGDVLGLLDKKEEKRTMRFRVFWKSVPRHARLRIGQSRMSFATGSKIWDIL